MDSGNETVSGTLQEPVSETFTKSEPLPPTPTPPPKGGVVGEKGAISGSEGGKDPKDDSEVDVIYPSSFDNWLRALADPHSINEGNGIAVLVRMGQHLYSRFPADRSVYGRVGKLAKIAGSQSKLARVLWNNASKPLAVPIDYLSAVVYAKDDEGGPPPRETTFKHMGPQKVVTFTPEEEARRQTVIAKAKARWGSPSDDTDEKAA